MKGEEVNRADIAASFQKAVVDVLVEHTMQAAADFGMKRLPLQEVLLPTEHFALLWKKHVQNGDTNFTVRHRSSVRITAMIGVAAYYEYIRGTRHSWDLNAVPNLKLGER